LPELGVFEKPGMNAGLDLSLPGAYEFKRERAAHCVVADLHVCLLWDGCDARRKRDADLATRSLCYRASAGIGLREFAGVNALDRDAFDG
jgi:hypothetical protein